MKQVQIKQRVARNTEYVQRMNDVPEFESLLLGDVARRTRWSRDAAKARWPPTRAT